MTNKYIHDEWCRLWDDECECYVCLLEQKDKRITTLEAEVERLRETLAIVGGCPTVCTSCEEIAYEALTEVKNERKRD